MKRLAISLLFGLLCGCATPSVESENPRSVTVNGMFANPADNRKLANEACQKYGRYARPSRDLGRGRYAYDCVD